MIAPGPNSNGFAKQIVLAESVKELNRKSNIDLSNSKIFILFQPLQNQRSMLDTKFGRSHNRQPPAFQVLHRFVSLKWLAVYQRGYNQLHPCLCLNTHTGLDRCAIGTD